MAHEYEIGEMIERLAKELPEGWIVEINIEQGAGWAYAIDPQGNYRDCNDTDFGLLESLQHYLEQAKRETKERA